jgi:putative DNA methylase
MPLVRSWWLGKKKGKEAYVVPSVVDGRVTYEVGHDPKSGPTNSTDGTVSGKTGARCVSCGSPVSVAYIRAEGNAKRMGARLITTVAEGNRARTYVAADSTQEMSARVERVKDVPQGTLADNPRWFSPPAYGLTEFADLFTNRQLTALTTFSDLVGEARERALRDAVVSGLPEGDRLETGGTDAAAYADAVATYLGLGVSRTADICNSLATWSNSRDQTRNLFSRQAIPMAWDFVEASPFARASGDPVVALASIADVLDRLPARALGIVTQADASARTYQNLTVSTDPPYYDNIGYSDLSDFFYVWLRRGLRGIHPKLLSTMLVPKAEELVANPYRHGGRDGAQDFFESGFRRVFGTARRTANDDFPITVYYAFKQAELEAEGLASTGWETLLSGMISEGWTVTATWPVRSERAGRMISIGTNALASSIVLALRPRPEDAPITDRRGFLAELKSTLPEALRDLQQGSVAPVDMAQAAIGPGMATFSKYARVIEPSGDPMTVRDALRAINGVLDEVLSQQEGDFDDDTRWCVAWFEAHGFDVSLYGDAETLASAKNASVAGLARAGVISSGGGKVKLLAPDELPPGYDPRADDRVSLWEVVLHMARELVESGLDAAGRILAGAEERGIDMTSAHELAYLLYAIAEKRGLTQPGILFNTLGSSWAEVRAAAATADARVLAPVAPTLDFDELEF